MRTLVFLLFFHLSSQVCAQCLKYELAMQRGDEFLYQEEPDFDKAMIEFQTAQIAARECRLPADKSDRARQKLDSVFKGLKIRRDQAVDAMKRAELAKLEISDALRLAEILRRKAESEKEMADKLRDTAQEQKKQADLFAKEADTAKNLNLSLNLALQSTLTEDSLIKTRNAVAAYGNNQQYNNGKWMPEITRALLGSIPGNALRRIVKLNSGIIDIFKIRSTVFLVTDSGELRVLDNNIGRKLWSDPGFYYVNNSWLFDNASEQLSLTGKNQSVYVFKLSQDTVIFKGSHPIEIAERLCLASHDYRLYPEGLFQVVNDTLHKVRWLTTPPSATAFAISPGNRMIAIGTGAGALEVFENSSEPKISRQFHREHTRINDILFDRNSEFIATGGNDGRVRLNKVEFMEGRAPIELNVGSWVNAIYFLDSMDILIGAKDGSLYALNFNQDSLAEQCRQILNKARGNIRYKK